MSGAANVDWKDEGVSYRVESGLALVRLARPERGNALSYRLRAALMRAASRAIADPQVKVICLGADGSHFGVGADLAEMARIKEDVREAVELEIRPFVARLRGCGKPVLCAINGVCAGMSIGVALAADLVVMAADARLVLPFAQIGLVPDSGVSWHLLHGLGYRQACALAFEGGELSAQRCLELGLVNQVVPPEALWSALTDWAARLVAQPEVFLASAKQLMVRTLEASLEQAIGIEGEFQARCIASPDFDAAVARRLAR
ncbi:enoyl-CoA hydratase/isomerase family protein [Spongiibacter taiwanensis]|uniref:enoyl-CoA hydratase/isomerase family protein n=1 Tax=Spongiibacter taiwanensis TaxID=1748242 RepID=UPI0020351A3F|nr:enoyl-CoA hydratase/isomerase family protein [Spongiibacter taiwanensis]USA42623.1 enoyl-CoA hydratase/isomerase family protein [Spongiibacter taiwanensis]